VFFEEGAEVPVLVSVAVIGTPGEDTAGFGPGSPPAGGKEGPATITGASGGPGPDEVVSEVLSAVASAEEVRIKISPRARKMATAKGIDISR
jgi:pyruvate dehydrogenase E2 component (dihydrolipoamide acetyltransferase)